MSTEADARSAGSDLTIGPAGGDNDTIAAIATPPGIGGVAIVRVSGPAAWTIAHIMTGRELSARAATTTQFTDADGDVIDLGIAVYFKAPSSFTGEDVVELHGHGGPVLADMVLQRTVALGARLARAGEFSLRAFLNDKLDLAQAEAISDLISSRTQSAARSAMRSLRGVFSERVDGITKRLMHLRVMLEADMDFPDEDIDDVQLDALAKAFTALRQMFEELRRTTHQGAVLTHGVDLVLAGAPNAGKSSVLNALLGEDRAIVSPTAGTTRDTLSHEFQIDGLVVRVTDTAGLRDTSDEIEAEGVRRATAAMENADHICLLIDDSADDSSDNGLGVHSADSALQRTLTALTVPVTKVYNKVDLSGRPKGLVDADSIAISAKTGEGIEELLAHLARQFGYNDTDGTTISARRRHVDALNRAGEHIQTAHAHFSAGLGAEFVAEELRLAQVDVGEITGVVSSEDLLGEIFSSFCIGK